LGFVVTPIRAIRWGLKMLLRLWTFIGGGKVTVKFSFRKPEKLGYFAALNQNVTA
jgi:hypothetical protein